MKNVLTKTWLLGLLIVLLGAIISTGAVWAKQWKDQVDATVAGHDKTLARIGEVDATVAEHDRTLARIDERLSLLPEIRDEQKRQRELMESHFLQSARP